MPPPTTATSGATPDIRDGVAIHHDATARPPLTAGERWTRSALEELRARRFTPAAWARFIGASAARSLEDLRRRPDLARQGAAAVIGGGVPWLAGRRWGALIWWSAVGAMLLTHIGMVEGPAGERRSGIGAANAVSLARAWLVPAIAGARDRRVVASLAAVAFVSDALDGPLARARGEETRLGAQMDHAVDVALTMVVADTARRRGWIPTWAAAAVAARYAVPVVAVTVHYFARAEAPPRGRFLPARGAGVLVATGLVGSAFGRRRVCEGLVVAGVGWGSLLAVASTVRSLREA